MKAMLYPGAPLRQFLENVAFVVFLGMCLIAWVMI